jgi:hypothetical protein
MSKEPIPAELMRTLAVTEAAIYVLLQEAATTPGKLANDDLGALVTKLSYMHDRLGMVFRLFQLEMHERVADGRSSGNNPIAKMFESLRGSGRRPEADDEGELN